VKPELPKRNTADRQNLYWEALGQPHLPVMLKAALAHAKAKTRLAAGVKLGTTRELR
jgi:hypothetical protein